MSAGTGPTPHHAHARPVLGVVVPVHDEDELLGDCLEALTRAARRVGDRAEVRTVVVLDDCRDASAAVAATHGVATVAVTARRVGVARHAGCRALLAGDGAPVDWFATTDADSRVPPDWLLAQLEALEQGHDARVGTVYVDDWGAHPDATRRWFSEVYDLPVDPHPHVHGANLGVRAAVYADLGGFRPVATAEDVSLVAALDAGRFRVLRTRRCPVLTSARARARAVDGFADRLLALGAETRSEEVVAGTRAARPHRSSPGRAPAGA